MTFWNSPQQWILHVRHLLWFANIRSWTSDFESLQWNCVISAAIHNQLNVNPRQDRIDLCNDNYDKSVNSLHFKTSSDIFQMWLRDRLSNSNDSISDVFLSLQYCIVSGAHPKCWFLCSFRVLINTYCKCMIHQLRHADIGLHPSLSNTAQESNTESRTAECQVGTEMYLRLSISHLRATCDAPPFSAYSPQSATWASRFVTPSSCSMLLHRSLCSAIGWLHITCDSSQRLWHTGTFPCTKTFLSASGWYVS